MEYCYTVQDLQTKTGFSMSVLRKILAEIQPLMTDSFVKGEKNSLMFNSNALVIMDKVKQLKNDGLNLPSIRKELDQHINSNTGIKTDSNTSINNDYLRELINQIKEANDKTFKMQSEVINAKEQVIKELNSRLLLITDGRPAEQVKQENQQRHEQLIRLEYEIKQKTSEYENLETELSKQKDKDLKLTELNKKILDCVNELSQLDRKWFVTKKKEELKNKISELKNQVLV